MSTWKKQAVDGLSSVFSGGAGTQGPSESEIKDLHAKIGRLAVENDFLAQGLNAAARQWFACKPREGMSPKERKKMVSKRVDISLSRQCKILRISRSSLYYTPIGFSSQTLELMHQIDRVFTKYPFFPSRGLQANPCRAVGSRQIAAYLPQVGYHAGRHPLPDRVLRSNAREGGAPIDESDGA